MHLYCQVQVTATSTCTGRYSVYVPILSGTVHTYLYYQVQYIHTYTVRYSTYIPILSGRGTVHTYLYCQVGCPVYVLAGTVHAL